MADPLHKSEIIMARVAELVTGATSVDQAVFRGQVYALAQKDDLPCLVVYMGPEVDLERAAHDELLIELEVYIDVYVAINTEGGLETELNKIHREIVLALVDDQTGEPKIDLAFVQYIRNDGREAPETNQEYETPAMVQRTIWTVVYTRDRKDPAN